MRGVRIIAFLLVVGGLLGILAYSMMALQAAREDHRWTVAAASVSIALFGFATATGVALWRKTGHGFAWARLLFALQVPTFSVVHFTYEFSTFLSIRVMIGNTTHYIGGNVGSSNTLLYSSQPLGWMFGINAVAVVALWYLTKASRALDKGWR